MVVSDEKQRLTIGFGKMEDVIVLNKSKLLVSIVLREFETNV